MFCGQCRNFCFEVICFDINVHLKQTQVSLINNIVVKQRGGESGRRKKEINRREREREREREEQRQAAGQIKTEKDMQSDKPTDKVADRK